MGQPAALLRAPSGLDLAILAPRSPASRRANGSRKSASGRSDSTARSRATRRAVSDTLRMRPSSGGAAVDFDDALLRSGSCMRGPYMQANLIVGIFGLIRQVERIVYPLAVICAELMRAESARGGSRGARGGGENQIRKKLAEAAARDLEFEIARGAVQPAKIDEQRNFGPRFRSFGCEADVAQHAGNMRGAFFLDAGNARGHALVAASPCAQRGFATRAGKIGAMFDEARPARCGVRGDDRVVQPCSFVAFPTVQHLRQQLFAILKMPVEAALADAEIARQQFNAHGFNSLGGKARKRGANPIVGLQWRRFKRGCGSHVVFYVCRGTIPECSERVKLRDCYDFTMARAAAKISGASPKPASQCTPVSLRNQVSWRLAKRRVACWICRTASFSLSRPARCSRNCEYPMNWNGFASAGTPLAMSARTSSSHPAASIASVRA